MTLAPSPLQWIQLTSSTDQGFNSLLKQALGSDTVPDTLTDILPLSVIITNNGTTPIAGVGFRYSVTRSDGKVVFLDTFYRSFASNTPPMMPPGKSIIITPITTLNDVAHGRYVPDPSAHVWEFVKQEKLFLAAASAMQASLDLVVSNDQRKAGPDTANQLGLLRDHMAGFMAAVHEMKARLKARQSDVELKTWLSEKAQRRITREDQFTAGQMGLVKDWLAMISAGKRGEVEAIAGPIPSENPLLTYLDNIKEGLK
jgi:hypothetical protein